MQGQANKAEAASQSAALKQNALYLNQSADDAEARGIIESDQYRVKAQDMIGTQRAAQAANGGLVNEGTNAIIQQDTAQLGELDALTISNNAAREAYGYRVEAQNASTNAATLTQNAKKSMFSSILGGAASGAASAYSGGAFSSRGAGAGTKTALGNSSPSLNYNQAYA